jgi:hypothetical protein
MSELKVNSISPTSGTVGVKFNSPVGINTNASTSGLQISGKLNVIDNNLEVVTVSGANYGLRIKAPPAGGDAVLQFADFNGNSRSTISSNSSGDLIFSPGGVTAGVMTSSGTFNMFNKTFFNNQVNFKGNALFEKQTTFSQNAIPTTS